MMRGNQCSKVWVKVSRKIPGRLFGREEQKFLLVLNDQDVAEYGLKEEISRRIRHRFPEQEGWEIVGKKRLHSVAYQPAGITPA